MKSVDSRKLHKKTEEERFNQARLCKHFAKDKHDAPCLWHSSFCLHPHNPDPEVTGSFTRCTLVWHGKCDFEYSAADNNGL